MSTPYVAVGVLYHPEGRKVLLHHRDANAPIYPNLWASFGGQSDDEDGGDPVRTWRREMREELGVDLKAEQVVALCDYVNPRTGRHRYVFYCEWPSLAEDFVLGEGDGFAWFLIDDALMLPDILDLAMNDLLALRERVAASGAD